MKKNLIAGIAATSMAITILSAGAVFAEDQGSSPIKINVSNSSSASASTTVSTSVSTDDIGAYNNLVKENIVSRETVTAMQDFLKEEIAKMCAMSEDELREYQGFFNMNEQMLDKGVITQEEFDKITAYEKIEEKKVFEMNVDEMLNRYGSEGIINDSIAKQAKDFLLSNDELISNNQLAFYTVTSPSIDVGNDEGEAQVFNIEAEPSAVLKALADKKIINEDQFQKMVDSDLKVIENSLLVTYKTDTEEN